MLNKIIEFSIKNKLIIGIFTLALIVWGVYSLNKLPIDAVPDITNNQVQIITVSPSLAAQEVEQFISFPVEQTMATIPEIQEIRSISRFGLSVVTVVFHDDADIYWARQQVSERLVEAKSTIPPGIGLPEMAPISTGLGEIYQYTLLATGAAKGKYDAMELRTLQDWIVRRQLLGTPGIADVSSFGGFLKQYEVAININRLRSYNLSIADVFSALEKNNQNTGGSYIDKRPNAYFIRSEGLITNTTDIGKIVIKKTDNGLPITVRDIGTVRFGQANRYGAMTRNNEGEVVGGLVLMLKGANASEVIQNVKAKVKQIQKSLPEGVVIEPFLDRSEFVGRAIGTVEKNLIEGALIVILVLILFLGNIRSGLIVASVIPLAMMFAIALMNVFGVSGNLMSLGAIDFGLIVDGAVIIVEATMHQLLSRKGSRLTQTQMDVEVGSSAKKMMNSAAFGQIIILIVYLPILALVGIEGKMFRPMAQTVSFAILGAFILSLTYVPMMSALFLNKHLSHKKNFSDKMMDKIQHAYTPLINGALRFKKTVVMIALSLMVIAFVIFSYLGGEFIPTLEEGDFAVETRLLTGSSLQETVDASLKAGEILKRKFPEVKEVIGKIGSSEIPTDPMPIEACDLMIILKPKSEWTSADNREDLAEKMMKELETIPGVTFGFQQPIQMRFNELMTGARQDIAIKIFGEDLEMLSELAGKVGKLIPSVEGAKDLYVEQVSGLPQISIKLNRDKIAQFGLNVLDINNAISTGFAGGNAGTVFEGERRFELIVRLEGTERKDIEDVKRLFVTADDGMQIPLEQIADISYQLGPNQIQREDAKRRITIGFNVRGRDIASVVKEVQAKIDQKVKMPTGYFVTYGGQFKNLEDANKRLSVAVPVALALILLLLYFTFGSFKYSLLIFTAIPMSAIGGVFALLIRGMPFSISAGVGFIALFGVAVLNGIVLITEFNRLKKEGITDINEIILKGTAIRLRPVLMTASVASLGFLPMALSTGAGAEVQKPLATVVIGGLITATFLTLIVLPVLYTYFEKIKSLKGHKNIPPSMPAVGLLVLLIFGSMITNAQISRTTAPNLLNSEAAINSSLQIDVQYSQQISLDSALNTALQNNKGLQAIGAEVDYYKQLKKTTGALPNTNVSMIYGQYNSYARNDNNITVSQTIPFPTVFGAKAALGNAQVKGALLKTTVTKNELLFQVKQTFFRLLYLQSYKLLLYQQDTLYTDFVRVADIKLKTGESTFLEKSNAATRLAASKYELRQNDADIKSTEQLLQSLLFVDYPVSATKQTLPQLSIKPVAESVKESNPQLGYLKQQVVIAEKNASLARQSNLPDITVGYFNQTLIGTPMNETGKPLAISSNRFQGVQVGVGIPLIAQRAKVKAEQAKQEVASLTYQANVTALQSLYRQRYQQALAQQNNLEYLRTTGLVNAELLANQSQKSYKAGEIGYAEFLLSQQQAYTIRQQYLKALYDYDVAILELEALLGNN